MKIHINGADRDKIIRAEMVETMACHPYDHPIVAHARRILEHYSTSRAQYDKAITKANKKRKEIYK